MEQYIFDNIDSDKAKRYIYATYTEIAFHNFFITLQHIYHSVKGEYPKIQNEDFGKPENTDFIFDDLTNAEDKEKIKLLANKHFPLLKVIENEFPTKDKIEVLKEFWAFLKVLRNSLEHDIKTTNTNFVTYEPKIVEYLRHEYHHDKMEIKKGIAIAAKKEMKERFFLEREPKSVDYFLNNCTYNSHFSFRSYLVFISLFLEDKYIYNLLINKEIQTYTDNSGQTQTKFYYIEQKGKGENITIKKIPFRPNDFTSLYHSLSIYNIKLPSKKYDAQFNNADILGLDIMNELQKCPKELYENISKEKQNIFRVQSGENADFPNEVLLVRFQDRFANLVLKYIDMKEVFKDIRFQVSLGKYRYKFYDKQCIDSETADRVRILQKNLKTFGRLETIETKRKTEWANVMRITDLENQAAADTAETSPYITDQTARYNIDKISHKIPLYWDGDRELPVSADEVKAEQKDLHNTKPKAFLSVYDLPSLMFLHFIGGNPELLIKENYENYRKFFTDVKDGNLTPENFSKDSFEETYKIGFHEVPKELQKYLTGKTEIELPDSYKNCPNKIKNKYKKDLVKNTVSKKLNEILEDLKYRQEKADKIEAGKAAAFLSKSIVQLMKDNNKKPTGKNYSVLQANLAVYENFEKIEKMFLRSEIVENHPFLKEVLDKQPQTTVQFYAIYLKKAEEFFCDIEKCSYLPFYKYQEKKFSSKTSEYYKKLAQEYLTKPVELTNKVFDGEIRRRLSEKNNANVYEKDSNGNFKYNLSYLINGYYENDCQEFYGYEPAEEKEIDKKALNRYKVQDKILLALAKNILTSDISDQDKASKSEFGKMKLQNINPKSNVLNQDITFDVKLKIGDKELTVSVKNIKLKNYTTVYRTIFDRRMDTLALCIDDNPIEYEKLQEEFKAYDEEALKINKLIYDFINYINDNSSVEKNLDFKDIYNKIWKKYSSDSIILSTIEFIKSVRNSFAHWSYPETDDDHNPYLKSLCENLKNKPLGEKITIVNKKLETEVSKKDTMKI